MKETQKRYEELKELLLQYAYQYYVLDDPSVSDAVYDGLIRELKDIENSHPEFISSDSPTQRVAAEPLDSFQKVSHSEPMISLNDVFSSEDVKAWVKRTQKLISNEHAAGEHAFEFFTDIKMDGLGCALIYQDGVFVQALTRGDGRIGEDVTLNVRTIKNVPFKLRQSDSTKQFFNGRLEVRGEIVMYKSDFAKLNTQRVKDGQPEFMNPRNLAAGTIRQLDPKLVAARPLYFHPYDILPAEASSIETNYDAYRILRELGLAANKEAAVFEDLDGVMKFVDKWEEKRHELPFITDGLVIKLNDRALYRRLGSVGKNPRAAVAYKYPAEEATTVVTDIVISIGRTGAATPVAVFNPVVVAGTTVQHASLHNADEITRKDIRVGDTVVIYKAGDIIPQVEKVLLELRPSTAKPFDYISELKKQYPELEFIRPEGEAVYRVKGLTGPLILKRSLEHFASKGALDIDTLGEKNVEALVDAGLVTRLSDLYRLTKEQLLSLERFAELSAQNLIDAIDSKKSPELPRFLYGLGIRHVGIQTASDLCHAFGSITRLRAATLEELRAVNGVGEVVAESILGWFADADNTDMLADFEALDVHPVYHDAGDGPLAGKSFVITGTLESMSRDEAADKIRALGGTFQTSVAKGTTYLVMGAKAGASKAEKAMKLGTEVINEKQLLEIIHTP